MNKLQFNIVKLLFVSLIAVFSGMAMSGCSDDEEVSQSQYGYVQFKLYKEASYTDGTNGTAQGAATRASVDKPGDAKKIEVEMLYNGTSITQTLVLNAYSDDNAEYGLRSDKLQLLVGDYKVVGYRIYDKLDQVITGVSADADEMFTVVPSGLTVKDLTIDAQARGSVKFKLEKQLPQTRANSEGYLFSDIQLADIQVQNTFSQVTYSFEKLKARYEEEYELTNPDSENDKYKDHGVAYCDSAVWLPAGDYKVISYTVYSKQGVTETELETQAVSGETFTVKDNQLTEYAIVPVLVSETAENIKDYLALKAIWDSMGGKNWSYYGETYPQGTNWNFNKDIDMWGDQPGVTLNSNGRVTSLTLAGFGATGALPDAIGQLTELRVLALGSHDETYGSSLFGPNGIQPDMSEAKRNEMRMDYKKHFLDRDIRANLSEMLQWSIDNYASPNNKIKKDSRISKKDTQIGILTNGITGVSKAIMRLKNLQQFYIANAPITYDKICTDWTDPHSTYAQQYAKENLSWADMTNLTDLELYNCANLTRLPLDMIGNLPELQLLNVACNQGITGSQLREDWSKLCDMPAGPRLQILYMGYNNLEEFPDDAQLHKMVKFKMLDCTTNKVHTLHSFGTDIKLSTLYLDNNKITSIPDDFCAFTNEVETLGFSYNELTEVPNIFNAKSIYIMSSVDFSHNKITGFAGGDDNFKGINAYTVSLSYNKLKNFPKALFKSGSPIQTLDLTANELTEVKEGDMQGPNAHLLQTIDLRFNKLTKLCDDFRATNIPYLSGIDLSYNSFSQVPPQPLNCSELKAFAIRYQRNEKGERTLRDWPVGITQCPSLVQLQIGSNDIRKVDETMTPYIWILDIKDNPNISIDLSGVCSAIQAGMYYLFYDKTQDICGCDILGIER